MLNASFLANAPFYELAILLILAAVTGFIGLLLRQPMIVSFIAVGVLAGPSMLGIVRSQESIKLLAELGVAVLLFLVGLKLDIKLIRSLGLVSLITGLGQVAFTAFIGFSICLALGLDFTASLYVAVALAFSSTIIIVKLLSDTREVDSLHGRMAIGVLIVQDLVVVMAMMVLSTFEAASPGPVTAGGTFAQIAAVLFYGCLMLLLVWLFIRFAATPLVNRIAHSPELLVTFALSWATLLAALGDYLGFSKELGGLMAGVSLASTPFREAFVARLLSLRDFLLLFFFIALGAHIDLNLLGTQIFPALVLSFFVLVGKPLLVILIMGAMGYRKRTGFLAGVTLAQISEFSLIFAATGVSIGHIQADVLGLVTLVGLITIALSVYLITYSHHLYRWLDPVLNIFERHIPHREKTKDHQNQHRHYDIILFGLGRYGAAFAEHLEKAGMRLLAVDFNPDELQRWSNRGYDAVYGDVCDQEMLASLPLTGVKWVISALPQHDLGVTHEDPRLMLIDALQTQKYAGKIAVSTQNSSEVNMLLAKGADLVFLPFSDAAKQAVERIMEASG